METDKYKVEEFILNETFQRYVLQNTQKDTQYWVSWINEHPDALVIIESAREILTFNANRKVLLRHKLINDQVYENLQKKINSEQRLLLKSPRKIRIRYYWYAASILLLIGVVVVFSRYNVRPGSSNLAGQYLEVIVPEGQRSQLILPDGTKVWLNSGTLFKYPTEFLKQRRDVYLDGEAFFNVKHNKKLPFIVHVKENLSVKVLGTEFNIKCYANEKVVETTLIKGLVKLIKDDGKNQILQEISLKPNEKATFLKTNQKFIVSKLIANSNKVPLVKTVQKTAEKKHIGELELITAWKEEKLVFNDETFEEIGIKMGRWFGMKITIADENLKQERFTGKFVNKETIYQVLDIFNRSEPIQYYTKNSELIITKRKNKTNH